MIITRHVETPALSFALLIFIVPEAYFDIAYEPGYVFEQAKMTTARAAASNRSMKAK